MNDWRPIETAPKDGTVILIWEISAVTNLTVPHVCMARWQKHRLYKAGGYWNSFASQSQVATPTWWMPLPAHPPDPT
jgi:hypothetical protein